jgi:hypothetical protein
MGASASTSKAAAGARHRTARLGRDSADLLAKRTLRCNLPGE